MKTLPACEGALEDEERIDRSSYLPLRATLLRGLALVGLGRHAESVSLLMDGISAARRGSVPQTDLPRAYLGLARAQAGVGNVKAALDAYKDARDAFDRISRPPRRAVRLSDVPPEFRAQWAAEDVQATERRAEWAVELRAMLPEYATLLQTVGRTRDAERMRAERDALE